MGSTTNDYKGVDDLNYFICTLGQADTINKKSPHDFQTITEFIDRQAEFLPGLPAVAFPIPRDGNVKWLSKLFTFEELKTISSTTAKYLEETVLRRPLDCSAGCVALLCPSSIDFLFAWLALMRMGYGVLLIAPQCQPEAISHLCNSCEVSFLLHDKTYSSLAADAAWASKQSSKSLVTAQLPWQDNLAGISSIVDNSSCKTTYRPFRTLSKNDIAYFHHTSGTSTGLPKPIPQTHQAAVGVLPCLDGSQCATFTTTPLYHGGIADCFRAWTSHALIWLFPGADRPITTSTILTSLMSASDASERGAPPVRYFSSVPYVLQMLAEDANGLEKLRGMEIVGVGGAALPLSVGDSLVSLGVNLVSRFGSAECGFLLSSHRDYARDFAWQYLRLPVPSPHLRFELQVSSGLYELVVLAGWPHIAKANREDGSFASADLFEQHPSIHGAWKYHSRKDAQLILVTGKKFDPQPLEDAITASSRLIGECLVFGSGRAAPGALIFRAEGVDGVESEVVDGIWGEIETINAKGQSHTRIERAMIVVLPIGAQLSKSSKGTVMRGEAEKNFAQEIEGAYNGGEEVSNGVVDDIDVLSTIRNLVSSICGKALGDDDDFYHCGIDSAKCTQIRALIQKKITTEAYPLPFNVVYDCGTISRLAKYIVTLRHDGTIAEDDGHQEMLDLVTQFSNPLALPEIDEIQERVSKPSRHTVILTGATGALGAHILDLLNQSSEIKQVFCLVRASSHQNALSRVNESLALRQKPTIGPSATKISCLPSELGEANLGLSQIVFTRLIKTVTLIIHAAWPVNFSLPLRTFIPQFRGLQTLLSLTMSTLSPHLLFCSSVASVLAGVSPVMETISHSPSDADSLGYSRSKWVAEQICHQFPGQSASICRIGQLTGDTKNGAWNMTEAYPRMFSTLDPLGCLPDLPNETLTWLPLDIAAQCVLEVALACSGGGVYHVVNNNRLATWADLLEWIAETEVFEVVEPGLWLERLEGLAGHPASGLVGLWKEAYRGDDARGGGARKLVFETEKTDRVASSARDIRAIDKVFFQKVWRWLRGQLGSMNDAQR